jgi:hypothetical protein
MRAPREEGSARAVSGREMAGESLPETMGARQPGTHGSSPGRVGLSRLKWGPTGTGGERVPSRRGAGGGTGAGPERE